MADVLGTINSIGGGVLNFLLIVVGVVIWVSMLVGVWFLSKRWKRYKEFSVVIWEKLEGGGIRESYDKAGIFIMRKSGNKLFYLKKSKIGLKPDNVVYLVNARGKKVVYLLRLGLKNFVFLNPKLDGFGGLRFSVGEEDVNWAINEYESNKKRFSQNLLMQILPFAVLALVTIIILILFIFLFKNIGVMKDVATEFRLASETLVNAGSVVVSNATTIGGGGVI